MKKATLLSFSLFFGIVLSGFSQTDFFAGKWQMDVAGTPQGDIRLVANLVRKDGKLTGELKDPTGKLPEAIPITNLEEAPAQITLYFSAQGNDVNVELKKVNADTLKGSLMNMFETVAVRLKDNDFFAGKWDIAVSGTPRGDVTFKTDLVRKDGKLTGELVNADDKRPITKIVENGNKITVFFESSQGGEISIDLEKVDENTLKGLLMSYEAKATRVK